MKRIALYILLVVATLRVYGQEIMGVKPDNYLPTFNARLNPSALAAQKPWIHIHLVGLEMYARNNLVYLADSKITQINSDLGESYNYSPDNYQAYVNGEVYGPSASIAFGIHSIGFHTGVRSFLSAKKIPGSIGEFINDDLSGIHEVFEIDNNRIEGTAWGEIGLSYARIIEQEGSTMLTGGITLKRLLGYFNGGVFIKNALFEIDGEQGTLYDLNGAYSISQPANNAGKGWGTDIGITYFKLQNELGHYIPHSSNGGCVSHKYDYKLGFSIVDLGFIHFDNDAEKGSLDKTTDTETIEDILDENSDAIVTESEKKFEASLPTALSAQFDYNINDQFYFNGSIIQKLSAPNLVGAERDNLLSASLRYEKRWMGFGLPLTLQNYENLQIGLALRAGPIIIGSDHILPFIMKSDIYAADFYFSMQFALMKHPSCRKKGKDKKSTFKGSEEGMPPCPKW